MLKRIGSLFLVFSLFFISAEVWPEGGDKVVATVSDNVISVGQTLALNISIDTTDDAQSVGNPRLPDLSGFTLAGAPQTSTQARSEFINGKFSFVKKQVYTYFLSATSAGKFVIGSAEVSIGDKIYKTQPITVTVEQGNMRPRAQQQQPQQQEEENSYDPFEEADKIFDQLLKRSLPQAQQDTKINPDEAFFIRVEVDKEKAFVGEQITASWYLYTRNNLSNFEPIKYPELRGFWKEDIEIATRLNFENVVINGVPYRKALLVSYALFPIKAGAATIDSYKMRATALMTNPFGSFGRPYTFTKVNPPVKIQVLPVPSENQPSDFTGAVGTFNLTAQVDRSTVPVNEPFSLKIRLDGRGNAKQIDLPPLNLPTQFEQYDTKQDSKFFKDGSSFKEFEILLIPRSIGDLEIPAVSMSVFNPATKKFETKKTQSIRLKVVQGRQQEKNFTESFLGEKEKKVEVLKLPDPVFKVSGWSLSQKNLNIVSTVGIIFSILLSILFFVINLREIHDGDVFKNKFKKRVKDIQVVKSKNIREASTQVLNLVDFVLSEITQDKDSHVVEVLTNKLSPIYKSIIGDDFNRSYRYFETVSFAPQDLIKEMQKVEKFDHEFNSICSKLSQVIDIYLKK